MNSGKCALTAFGLATTLTMSACACLGREEHAVTLSAGSEGLTLIADGVGRRIPVEWRFTSNQASTSEFEFVVDAIDGSKAGEGVALTVTGSVAGSDPASSDFVSLTMALPVSLQQGDIYAIGSTFTTEVGVTDSRAWGAHDLQQSNQADVAFAIATYTFPPPVYTVKFRAVSSTGSIRVTSRSSGFVELLLNLSFSDGNGTTRFLNGPVRVNLETFNASCA
jgi:hypothetical protein